MKSFNRADPVSKNLAPASHPPIELSPQEEQLLEIARLAAMESPDRSRKTGAIVVDAQGQIVAFGFNTLPDGVEHADEFLRRPAKYDWTEHAERNAIFQAARSPGKSTDGCTMVLPWFPCVPCARAIVQSGIRRLVSPYPDVADPSWGEDFKTALKILEKGGVRFDHFIDDRPPPKSLPEGQVAVVDKPEGQPPIERVVEHWNRSRRVLGPCGAPASREKFRP